MRGMAMLKVTLGLALVCSLVVSLGLSGGRARAEERNSCGCYKDTAGTCYCDKKAKCGCPGDCEPKGCEEKRDKALQKEIAAETKKASAAGNKRPDPEAAQGSSAPAPSKSDSAGPASKAKMTAAQAKQLGKLLDLYLGDHPDARGKSIEDVRGDVGR